MTDPSTWDVYLVTDRSFSQGRATLEVVEAAVSGGVSAVQLREKDLCTRDFYREGVQLREFLRSHRVPLIINDRIDIALALDADGVHLGQEDMPLSKARQILGPDCTIGISINEISQITRETVELSDYLAISPVFSTLTKPDATAPWELEGVQKVRSLTRLPLVAIGSIRLQNAREVVLAGADCIAVVTAITAASDIADATRQLVDEVRHAKSIRRKRPPEYS
jgi:thiamine-phosphate pyrophosphorylase